jgi:hypothetical protein
MDSSAEANAVLLLSTWSNNRRANKVAFYNHSSTSPSFDYRDFLDLVPRQQEHDFDPSKVVEKAKAAEPRDLEGRCTLPFGQWLIIVIFS